MPESERVYSQTLGHDTMAPHYMVLGCYVLRNWNSHWLRVSKPHPPCFGFTWGSLGHNPLHLHRMNNVHESHMASKYG